jgi:apolipoprotein N-acyltransferase
MSNRRPESILITVCLAILVGSFLTASAKDQPEQVIIWPESGSPVLRFTFGKFKEISSLGNQHNYIIDTTH